MTDIEKILNFVKTASNLKTTLRWTTFPSGRKESSAEHSWMLTILAFLVIEKLNLNLDLNKVTKMCLIHDLPESITGDYDAYEIEKGNLSKDAKEREEKIAMKKLRDQLPQNHGKQIFDLWQEYEYQETSEARFVKALDKIETLHQIAKNGFEMFDDAYDHMGFYGNKQVLKFPELKTVMAYVKKELKTEYLRGGYVWKDEYEEIS